METRGQFLWDLAYRYVVCTIIFQLCSLCMFLSTPTGGYSTAISHCDSRWSNKRVSDATVTFIMPSMSRTTLTAAILSVTSMSNPNWLLIVVFDGLVTNSLYLNSSTQLPVYYHQLPLDILHDDRVCFIHAPLNRANNCAGGTRNYAIQFVKTKWVGFIDDDDVLDSGYVDHLINHEKAFPNAMAVLFRMCHAFIGGLVPRPASVDINFADVGISYAVQTIISRTISFDLPMWRISCFFIP
jgi:glycosyltransferase involved in cell wall biosynthesis